MPPLSFAFPHTDGSANSLATKDQSDVGPLSCRVTLKPVSAPFQHGLRFFRPPNPHHHRRASRPTVPVETRGDTRFPRAASEVRGVRCLTSTGEHVGHEAARWNPPPAPVAVLAQACQPLWLVVPHDLYRRFTYVHHTRYLAITR